MSNNTVTYAAFFLSALIALGIPVFLWLTSILLGSRTTHIKKNVVIPSSMRMNFRFFSGISTILILVAMVLLLIPCVGVVNSDGLIKKNMLIFLVLTGIFALTGLLYSIRKEDVFWVRSFRKDEPSKRIPS